MISLPLRARRRWRHPLLLVGVWFSLMLPPSGLAADKRGAADELFTNAAVRHLEITISPAGLATLRQYSFRARQESERVAVPATVREGPRVWTNVAVHLKGAFGSFRPVDDKPALTLNFDKLAEGQRFHGLQKISLNNSVQDPTYLNEKICRELFQAAGVPVPRADYATVELNGRRLGLFVLVEGWNKQFLKSHFSNVKGNFYDLGGSHDVNKPLPADFGHDPTNHAALQAVTRAALETDHAQRLAALRTTLDLDRFLSLLALDVLFWNWDGYAMNRNNYRFFHDLAANRVVIFPHGLDQMFWKANGPIVTGRSGLVAKALLETEEGRQLYLERLRQMRATVFDATAITNRIAELERRLAPAVARDGLFAVAQHQNSVSLWRSRILARARDVDQQLAGVKNLLRLPVGSAVSLTNWSARPQFGNVLLDQTTAPSALHLQIKEGTSFGAWNSTLWLEEGCYRLEGRIKTRGVTGTVRNETAGAGFRVWSDRKDTRGASWGWFPYGNSRDRQLGGLLPVTTNTFEVRLTGDQDWMTVSHDFELRQPVADLQIQCVLMGSAGEAWFDLASLKIRRTALNVSKSSAKGD